MTAIAYLEELEYTIVETRGNCFDIYRYGESWEGFTIEQLEGFARARGWEA